MPDGAKPNTGETDVPAAGEPTGPVESQPQPQPQAAEPPLAAGEPKDDRTVPLAAHEDERRKRQEAEQERDYMRQMVQLQQQPDPRALAPQQPDPLGLAEVDDEEIVDGRTVKRLIGNAVQAIGRGVQQEMFLRQNPDYTELVGSVNPTTGQFQMSPIMDQVIKRLQKESPRLAARLSSDPDAQVVAYELAKAEKARLAAEQQKATPSQTAQKGLELATAPMSPAAVGGGGAVGQEGKVSRMSDEEFERLDREVERGLHG